MEGGGAKAHISKICIKISMNGSEIPCAVTASTMEIFSIETERSAMIITAAKIMIISGIKCQYFIVISVLYLI